MGRKPVTLEQVAQLAGVSLATASKALNNKPRVSDRARRLVRSAAQQLSYLPNSQARSLASGKSQAIGAITSDLTGRFSTPILIGAEDELGVLSNTLLLSNARGDARLEQHHLNLLLSRNVDGILMIGAETDPRPHIPGSEGIPTIYVYAPSMQPGDCSVIGDNVEAGRMAANHLISCGRHHIAVIAGGQLNGIEVSGNAAAERLRGALEAMHDAKLEPAGPVRFGSWSESWGRAATRLLLEQRVPFDGVICQCDEIARGCMDALKEHGLHIPADVAVIGHDNRLSLAPDASPPLTSIDNSTELMGHIAAHMLMEIIDGNPRHGIEYVHSRLVQRGSTLPIG